MDRFLFALQLLLTMAGGFWLLTAGRALAVPPSFDCAKVKDDSIEKLICSDEGLASLDRQLADVYREAGRKTANEHPPVLKAEQRGWIKGRNECWKSEEKRHCIEENYRLRIAELQARYRLVAISAEATYQCSANPADVVIATYFATEPPSLIAKRGDQVSLMFLQPSGSGARYQGQNETLWEHQGEALITWGYGSEERRCRLK